MPKTLDIVIGATTVLLLFSMAVTVITQAITSLFQRKGKHLKAGLASLLQQLGISDTNIAQTIAGKVLTHPMIASAEGKLGSVIHRDEFTRLLLDLSAGQGAGTLETSAKNALLATLKQNGVSDPAEALKNVHEMALQIEKSNPEIANHVRAGLAVLHGASSDFVARINSWFDQSMDRVSEKFTKYTHRVVFGVSALVVLLVQLDMIAVVNRLSIDDQFRNTLVSSAAKDFSAEVTKPGTSDPKAYYDLLNKTGLLTLPFGGGNWSGQLADARKWPGMLISILLLSLGAPFWYNVLKDLLKLRSDIAGKDDTQRAERQSTAPPSDGSAAGSTSPTPGWLRGESGDLGAVG